MSPRLWATVPRLLAANLYCVLATADEDGTPWATPVFFAAPDHRQLWWVSSATSRHSRNIAVRPRIAVTVFDSTVPVGGAEALYLVASAAPSHELTAGLTALNARVPHGKELEAPDLAPAGPLTLYHATISRYFVLVRGGDPDFENVIDQRLEVHPPATGA